MVIDLNIMKSLISVLVMPYADWIERRTFGYIQARQLGWCKLGVNLRTAKKSASDMVQGRDSEKTLISFFKILIQDKDIMEVNVLLLNLPMFNLAGCCGSTIRG